MRSTKINLNTYDYIDKEIQKISTLPIFIDDNGNHNINSIKANAKNFAITTKVDLIIIDYLQLINGVKANSSANRVQELSEISRGLKSLSKEIGCPIIALSQLSRSVESRENKRPFMSDLRDSGSIEQDADMVLLLFREEYYHQSIMPDTTDGKRYSEWSMKMDRIKGKAEVIVAKNRFGKTGVSNLEFEPTFTRFKSF
jgi:replicative DNA helicase